MAQRSARGSGKQISSGSSSDANTPTRRVRPSSARPPAPGTRPQRSPKSSSEPREIPPPNRTRRIPTQQSPTKLPPTKSPPKASSSSSTSSPSKGSPGIMRGSVHTTKSGSSNRKPTTSSSASTPKASPYGSPKHSSIGRASSSSASSKTPTPIASPRKNAASMSPHRKSVGASPQHRVTGSASPQPRSAGPASAKPSTSRSSSRTSTPSSSAKSSPCKANTTSKSPSKVPKPKVGTSPSKRREESASPARTPKSSNKQETIRESSAEEDERVLAEILFQQETFSNSEASDAPLLARQRTMTLSIHEDVSPANTEAENTEFEHASGSNSLIRQNTVTLSKTEDEDTSAQCCEKEFRQDTITGGEEESLCQEKNDSDRIKQSTDVSSSGVSRQGSEVRSVFLCWLLVETLCCRDDDWITVVHKYCTSLTISTLVEVHGN
ncbi:E3 ubiquitin-protein ligase rnf213-alpha-like [Homarus americanus]|uniref:E3 ubiquitin-protein ligase rnf213-alpha-like n=1 Tax=Homarus americanus TaxID=6706 RepID=A0A8J5JUK2_HOMAM|nr:E3 ubiquitin-protein ligase rnf213-alpha-like [Homarus americanus]